MISVLKDHVSTYSTLCTSKKYGHSPVKESEVDPWEKLCVNFIRSLYLWPALSNRHDTINRGSEFMGEFARMVQKDYGVQKKANNYEKSSGQ